MQNLKLVTRIAKCMHNQHQQIPISFTTTKGNF